MYPETVRGIGQNWWLIDCCLMPTLAVFQLHVYHAVKKK